MVFEPYASNGVLAPQKGLRGQLIAILSDLFQAPIDLESVDVSREELDVWDSFNHLRLVMELEQRFAITLSDADTLQITSLQTMESLLRERGVPG